ncbi:MAG: DUF2189 domain-containing protein [Acidiphilium sp.]|nr:DUF2189 domain-containing protein [Acidiphilium sp.]MDD4936686.1 DUF2189 domain-containing protein [Acidiphilium sp.]
MRAQNPFFWPFQQLANGILSVGHADDQTYWDAPALDRAAPMVQRIGFGDLGAALADGVADFSKTRADAVLLIVILPIVGLCVTLLAAGHGYADLIFPLFSGFVLVSPISAFAFYEMSRRLEANQQARWYDALGVLASPAIGSVALLSLTLISLFILWMGTANFLFVAFTGKPHALAFGPLLLHALTTLNGWGLIVTSFGIGFVFAVIVLALSVVSFPMVLDRPVGFVTAIGTSLRAFALNAGPLLAWGLIVALGLALGCAFLLVGLVVVLPILGHATWHLYRRLVRWD